ncbi:transporter substrate-binding domain-containing protein [Pseudomonas sp. USTB-Z]|uniref:Amino acid ABC transporter substrate-binding protein, PAAT family n=1 Tax=Pseudomonas putida (strain ATCC 700007 / DSM 6899 / JCM 31910 / BCRC 17059 / LMG 24140 / F1) TaxID=351746 RepID=A5VXW4_PSEP1|nr:MULTISPECIES: transporter substrate-binding domain-containing protein [Pseudomonas]MBX6691180.1 transporter substrate-binding domain-containing protein [Pseudomonas sp. USTB-Z]MDD1999865.1 transporter substrate-binding domain-containing protein [Pseudomonas putida]POA85374.1 ABC transporter substrate-binding protein [Pseudomonas sp. FW305-E2]HDS1790026.1 transporter substrate-binding domain-containing protein [Pseudomonas putida]HEN8733436.1 transporter substrate-binding domain-containing p
MAVRTVLLAMLLSIAPWVTAAEGIPKQIHLVSEEWLDYTNADGTGVAWDVLRKVFEPAGVEVVTQSAPYSRAVGLVKRGEADAWVGSYKEENDDNLYPRWHFDMDHIYALGLASKPAPTLDTIGKYRLAWVRGYDYGSYLPNVREFREIQRREGILPMLEHDRVDYYIDALTEVDYVLGQASQPERFRRTHVAELPLYLAFARNDQAKALCDLFDKRMKELVRSGELKPIFEHWKQPYPFNAGSHPH